MYKTDDVVVLKGKNKNTGKVITYDDRKKAYLIDRGYKQSWIWEVNIIRKVSN